MSLLLLQPVFRGFIALALSGAAFPLCGVLVLRLDLIPLRYMLMHGVILGGALALALNVPLVPAIIFINCILVLMMIFLNKTHSSFSAPSAAIMVLSMALASLIMHVKDVPAKDTLSILWGSPFALTVTNVIILAVAAVLLVLYISLNYKNILPIFFSRDIAVAMGIKVRLHETVMIFIVAITIALAMQLLGAFLIDTLLILPVLCAETLMHLTKNQRGIKKLFIFSSVLGFIFSTGGFILALKFDFPPAATIALTTGALYAILLLFNRRKKS